MRKTNLWSVALAALTSAFGIGAAALPAAPAAAGGSVSAALAARAGGDQLILKDGRIIEGEFISETATEVRFLVKVGPISAEQTYAKADILAIERGTGDSSAEASPGDDSSATSDESQPARADGDGPVVYVMDFHGWFRTDVTVQSVRKAVDDAKKHRPDYIVMVMDNLWQDQIGNDLPDDAALFDELFYTEEIEPIFTAEIPKEWGYEPEYIVWVKSAMGGLCFLPLNFRSIYFHPEGRLGGVGNLLAQFGQTGDHVVREKQFSLRLGVARGMAIRGGYDPRLAMALAREDFVLSYRMVRGEPELLERLPEGPGEILLTDNGTDTNYADGIAALARGQGNDTLTLRADNAYDLRVSKGTVSSLTDLLREEGLARTARVIEGSRDIFEDYGEGVIRDQRLLFNLMRDFQGIQVQGDYGERTRARGQQKRKLEQAISIMKRYEGIRWPQDGGPWVPQFMPPIPQLEVMIEQIKQEQMKDRR